MKAAAIAPRRGKLVALLARDHRGYGISTTARDTLPDGHFIRVLRGDPRQDLQGYPWQLGLTRTPFKINLYVAFGLALQAGVAHGRKPPLRLAIIFEPAIFHWLMKTLAHVVEHNSGFVIARHGKTHTIGTALSRHMAASASIAYVAELTQFNF